MARGGITIEDDVQIAGNVSLLSNNHDPYDRMVLTCKPIWIQKGAWIGANAVILAGVFIINSTKVIKIFNTKILNTENYISK